MIWLWHRKEAGGVTRARFKGVLAAAVIVAICSLGGVKAQADDAPLQTSTSGLAMIDGMDIFVDGSTLHMLVSGPEENSAGSPAVLRYTRSDDGGQTWSEAVAIDTTDGPPHHAHRGNDSQIAARGSLLTVNWQVAGSGYMQRGPMHAATSTDGGLTWQRVPSPTDDGTDGAHAFSDINVDSAGIFHHAWLDDRSGRRGLRYARSLDGGQTWTKNATIDDFTCECCWNTVRTVGAENIYVLYRNVEPRDMALARSLNGGKDWQLMGAVGAFEWQVDICPHVGGGLSIMPGAVADTLHALIWTGKEEVAGVYYYRSADSGEHWEDPQRFGGAFAKHVDILSLDAEHIVAVWDEQRSDGSAIHLGRSADGGDTWDFSILHETTDWLATHPKIVHTPFGLRLFWTEQNADGQGVWVMLKL